MRAHAAHILNHHPSFLLLLHSVEDKLFHYSPLRIISFARSLVLCELYVFE
jgi:hypothetical protein